MNKLINWLYVNRTVEEIIFSMLLIAGIPYFTINEIIDLTTNRSLIVFFLNITLLLSVIYLLRLSIKRKITKKHIFIFSLTLMIAFTLFWPASTGLSGPGAYVLQSLIVVLLIINTGKANVLFAIYLAIMILVAGFANIDYTGKIVYTNQLISFILNMIVIALSMNLFKIALDRERKKLLMKIEKMDTTNEQIKSQTIALEKNQEEIKRMQTQLQEIIQERTQEIEDENERMIEYAFINAHLLRAPLANMLGLSDLKKSENSEYKMLYKELDNLDQVVRKIGGVLSVGQDSKNE